MLSRLNGSNREDDGVNAAPGVDTHCNQPQGSGWYTASGDTWARVTSLKVVKDAIWRSCGG